MTTNVNVRGYSVLVDACDLHYLESHKWVISSTKKKYVIRATTVGGKRVTLSLHRLIIGAKDGEHVDHRNGNSLDNRRDNLRIVSRLQNNQNSAKTVTRATASRFKGVTRWQGKWLARIKVNKVRIHLGVFSDEVAAAYAYDLASFKHHAEYGWRNFLPLHVGD